MIGVIYRLPSENSSTFVEKFDELFSKFTRKGKVCYISADFNLDLLQFQNNSITAQFLENPFSFSFLPLWTPQ